MEESNSNEQTAHSPMVVDQDNQEPTGNIKSSSYKPPRSRSPSRSLSHDRSRSRSPPRRSTKKSDRRAKRRLDSRNHSLDRSRSRSRSRTSERRRRPRSLSHSRSLSPRRRSRSYERRRSPDRRRSSPLRGTRENPEPTEVLGLFGLSLRTKESDLESLMSKYGKLEKVIVVYDHRNNRSRGFGFATFAGVDAATRARDALNGIELQGRKIRVDYSLTQRPHDPTPGHYMGDKARDRYRTASSYRGPRRSPIRRRSRSRSRSREKRRSRRDRSRTRSRSRSRSWSRR